MWILLQKKENYTVKGFLTKKMFRTLVLWEISTFFQYCHFLEIPGFLLPASLSGQQYYTQRQNPAESVFYLCTHTMCIIPLFSVDSSGGPAASSVFHVHGFSKGLGCSKLAVSQSNCNSTMTRSSFLLCGAFPQERFGDHNVLI